MIILQNFSTTMKCLTSRWNKTQLGGWNALQAWLKYTGSLDWPTPSGRISGVINGGSFRWICWISFSEDLSLPKTRRGASSPNLCVEYLNNWILNVCWLVETLAIQLTPNRLFRKFMSFKAGFHEATDSVYEPKLSSMFHKSDVQTAAVKEH